MKQPEYADWIAQARTGDLDAFARLVAAFQDLATGLAFGWLGDLEAARDVTQEAFLDAYTHLEELRDPRAFPGWLRRIVVKRCDRVTRRRTPVLEPAHPEQAAPAADPLDVEIAQAAQGSDLRLAVGALPPHERIVVALGYFADLTGTETAALLGLPLSTVKKRLRDARARLRAQFSAQGDDLMQHSLTPLRPSESSGFTEVVTFFLALRAGDHPRVRAMLAQTPALAEAVQEWEPDLVTTGVLPFAKRTTAAITAIERDDLTMLRLLLDAGAPVDGPCGCATGESPAWAAAVLDRRRHLALLLDHGADPDLPSASGTTPLQVAAMRGNVDLAELLLGAGADPGRPDRQGLTAADWARRNGHEALAERLRASGAGHPATEPGAPIPAQSDGVLFTGIKAVDLFCPIARGGVVRVPFMAGVGMAVLIGELCERIVRRGGAALWTGFAQRPFEVADWRTDLSELGIADRVQVAMADADAPPQARREAFQRGLAAACHLRGQGVDVLLVLLGDAGFEGDVEAALPELMQAGSSGSITTLLVTPFPERPELTLQTPTPPFAAQLQLDRARARRGLYPAVHPSQSWSRALTPDVVGARHCALAAAARALLERHTRQDPQFLAVPRARVTDPHFAREHHAAVTGAPEEERSLALLQYLSQPFHVAEPFTGRPGQWVTQEEMLTHLAPLLAGSPGAD